MRLGPDLVDVASSLNKLDQTPSPHNNYGVKSHTIIDIIGKYMYMFCLLTQPDK